MTKDEMIVAGAKAIFPLLRSANGNSMPVDENQLAEFAALFEAVEAVLLAVIPGIMAGTHAELPIEATLQMIDAGDGCDFDDCAPAITHYDAMVAAYREEKAKP